MEETKISVLIVEDEALIAANLRFTLEDLGYSVAGVCHSFAQAAKILPTTTAELVMLDINLGSKAPDETGLQLAAMVPAGKPFIFLTAYSDVDTIRQATRLRPAGYLIKPVNPAAVFAAIQTAIERGADAPPAQPPLPDSAPPEPPDFFFVKMGARTHKLMWREVYCIEAGKNYVKLRVQGGGGEYAVRGTLAFVTEQLLPERLRPMFVRVNRGVVLNRASITTVTPERVYCGGEEFENTRLDGTEW